MMYPATSYLQKCILQPRIHISTHQSALVFQKGSSKSLPSELSTGLGESRHMSKFLENLELIEYKVIYLHHQNEKAAFLSFCSSPDFNNDRPFGFWTE